MKPLPLARKHSKNCAETLCSGQGWPFALEDNTCSGSRSSGSKDALSPVIASSSSLSPQRQHSVASSDAFSPQQQVSHKDVAIDSLKSMVHHSERYTEPWRGDGILPSSEPALDGLEARNTEQGSPRNSCRSESSQVRRPSKIGLQALMHPKARLSHNAADEGRYSHRSNDSTNSSQMVRLDPALPAIANESPRRNSRCMIGLVNDNSDIAVEEYKRSGHGRRRSSGNLKLLRMRAAAVTVVAASKMLRQATT